MKAARKRRRAVSWPMSALAKVGSRVASTAPLATTSPGRTWMWRMMAVSRGWTTMGGVRGTSMPRAETTRSTSDSQAQAAPHSRAAKIT